MPSLAAPAGATPSLLSLLTPVAVAPVAPGEGAAAPSFADIVAGLTTPPALPPAPLPIGQTLPVERPEIAGAAPAPVDEIDPLLAGCGWTPELDQSSGPVLLRPIARFDPVSPAEPLPVLTQPSQSGPAAALDPELPAEPDLPTPLREVLRRPLRAAVLASAPEAVIARAIQPGAGAAPEPPTSGEEDTPQPRLKAERELAIGVVMPEPQPAPEPLPVTSPPNEPLPTLAAKAPDSTAPVATLPIATARPASAAAPVEPQNGLAHVPAQTGDAQPDSQPQPQPQPKPTIAPATPADLRIAPELARQVAQMIQPGLERAAESQPAPVAPVEAVMPTPSAPAPQPIAAPAPVQPTTFQSAPVDLGRAGWVEAMIERIAELPQVDRREAQIKLLPDMLGKVEVTLVERDERVHVTLNAETPQARQLLTEAAPRLQELAEARGLRLAQTEIGGGTSQDRRAPQDQNQPQTPLRPRSAQAEPADDTSTPDGERIA